MGFGAVGRWAGVEGVAVVVMGEVSFSAFWAVALGDAKPRVGGVRFLPRPPRTGVGGATRTSATLATIWLKAFASADSTLDRAVYSSAARLRTSVPA